jgi:flavin reductase (DIM6/NTAB) family NADH-FMN oxidoreductase RutF
MNLDFQGPAGARAYQLLTNIIVPRPIAWVTSKDRADNINLAPFSFFNMVGSDPPTVVIGVGNGPDGYPKHTAANIAQTREFVVNLVTEDLIHPMNISAADFPAGHSELEAAGLHAAPSATIAVPRVAEAHAALECALHKIERIGGNNIIIGEVVGLYIADSYIDPRLRIQNFAPVGRMGTPSTYARTIDRFELPRIGYADWLSQSQA